MYNYQLCIIVWFESLNMYRYSNCRRLQDAKEEMPPNLFTYAEVATHSTEEDCWLIIAGKVYDVTPWSVIGF